MQMMRSWGVLNGDLGRGTVVYRRTYTVLGLPRLSIRVLGLVSILLSPDQDAEGTVSQAPRLLPVESS